MESNLVTLSKLKSEIVKKGLNKYAKDVGYSKRKNKKYYVVLKNGVIVHFGDKRYEDFLIHGDEKRRNNYRNRHKSDNLNEVTSPGFWSYFLLW